MKSIEELLSTFTKAHVNNDCTLFRETYEEIIKKVKGVPLCSYECDKCGEGFVDVLYHENPKLFLCNKCNEQKVKELEAELIRWKDVAPDRTNLQYILSLESHNADLEQKVKELEKENRELKEFKIEELHIANGNIDLWGSHPIIMTLAGEMTRLLEVTRADNFLSVAVTNKQGQSFSMVIQKENGKTPAEKLCERDQQITDLKSRLEKAEGLVVDTRRLRVAMASVLNIENYEERKRIIDKALQEAK